MTSLEGQCVVYLLISQPWSISWGSLVEWYVYTCLCPLELLLGCFFDESSYRKLLQFRLNGESGELVDLAVMDGLAGTYVRPGAQGLCAGKSPLLFIPAGHGLVFDTRTRVFYELPEFNIALVRGGSYE